MTCCHIVPECCVFFNASGLGVVLKRVRFVSTGCRACQIIMDASLKSICHSVNKATASEICVYQSDKTSGRGKPRAATQDDRYNGHEKREGLWDGWDAEFWRARKCPTGARSHSEPRNIQTGYRTRDLNLSIHQPARTLKPQATVHYSAGKSCCLAVIWAPPKHGTCTSRTMRAATSQKLLRNCTRKWGLKIPQS